MCVRHGSEHYHYVLLFLLGDFRQFSAILPRNANEWTNIGMDGWTNPLIEMRGRIKKPVKNTDHYPMISDYDLGHCPSMEPPAPALFEKKFIQNP